MITLTQSEIVKQPINLKEEFMAEVNQLPYTHSKEAIGYIVSILKDLQKALKDGIGIEDIPILFPIISNANNIVDILPIVKTELQTSTKYAELIRYTNEQLQQVFIINASKEEIGIENIKKLVSLIGQIIDGAVKDGLDADVSLNYLSDLLEILKKYKDIETEFFDISLTEGAELGGLVIELISSIAYVD